MTRFVTALERSGLAEFLADFPGDSVDRLQWAAATRGLDGELRALAGFLLLGEPAAADRLPAALAQALPALVGSGVAVRRGDEVRLVDVSLFRSAGVWLFAEPPSPFPVRHYFGRDSVALARRTGCRAGDRVLDLCSGPGFQGLVAAQRGPGPRWWSCCPRRPKWPGSTRRSTGWTTGSRSSSATCTTRSRPGWSRTTA
nr:N-methyltransferase [Streptomyces sp. XY332]